jgi:hypothetical protein
MVKRATKNGIWKFVFFLQIDFVKKLILKF